jgi:hypothetical protein
MSPMDESPLGVFDADSSLQLSELFQTPKPMQILTDATFETIDSIFVRILDPAALLLHRITLYRAKTSANGDLHRPTSSLALPSHVRCGMWTGLSQANLRRLNLPRRVPSHPHPRAPTPPPIFFSLHAMHALWLASSPPSSMTRHWGRTTTTTTH